MRNGDVFEGKFVNGKLNGKGFFKSKDNNIYIGDFVKSMRNGKVLINYIILEILKMMN